ncbi:four helix bundle protein, partial [Tamlana crocina]
DGDAENSETQVWLEYAFRCKYLLEEDYKKLQVESEEVGKLINYMILNPGKFGVKTEE